MTIKISYQKKVSKKTSSSNLILFADEKFNIGSSKKYLSSFENSYISDLLKVCDLKKKILVLNCLKKFF